MAMHHRLIHAVARLFWRVTRPRTIGVRAVLVDGQGRIALVRHTYAAQWYLPGGGVKKGESIADALHRELHEEVAITGARVERVLGVYHNRREGKDDHVTVFVAHTAPETQADPAALMRADVLARADVLEIAEARWFDPADLPADTSPATRRRIAEYNAGETGLGGW